VSIVNLDGYNWKNFTTVEDCRIANMVMNVTIAEPMEVPARYAIVLREIVTPNENFRDWKLDLAIHCISQTTFEFIPEPKTESEAYYPRDNR
jgi:hypothetical protein